jgi:hypothetical protein
VVEPTPEPRLTQDEPFDTGAPRLTQDEQYAERARRADRATRGALAGVLGLEALVTLLVPRALAYSNAGLGTTKTVVLIGFAVILILAAGMQRRHWGIGLGSALQLPLVLSGVWLWGMFLIGALFVAIWLYLLKLRHELVGTPGGPRVLIS